MITFILDVEEDGTAVVSVEGAKGESCYDITSALEKKGQVVGDSKTEEYYEQPQENLNVNRR